MTVASVDIVNAALRRVGGRAISAINDTTPSGEIAGDVLTFERDALLRAHTWNFATGRTKLERLAETPVYEWTYAYRLPTDWLRTVSVHDNDAGSEQVPYKHESAWPATILTNGDFAAATAWSGAAWSLTTGAAVHTAGTATGYVQTPAVAPVSGGIYRVIMKVSGMSAGTITPEFTTGATTVSGTARSADGTWVDELTSGAHTVFSLTPSSAFDGTVDDVSVVRIDTGAELAIMSDAEDIYLRYIRQVADYDLMTSEFQQALIVRMAMVFATPLASSNTLLQLLAQEYKGVLRAARSVDGMEDMIDQFPVGSWASSRSARGWQRGSSNSWPR